MNYRHAFHAGSFADVLKHAILVRVLVYLRAKPAAFRVLDTHAGAGLYDLAGPEASRSLEWRSGIERLVEARLSDSVAGLVAPYLDLIAEFNRGGRLGVYPGSPMITRALLRPNDRLLACELEPNAAAALARNLAADRRAKMVEIDGWTAIKAYVPPVERRGLVLIDPPFEEEHDFVKLGDALSTAHRKWPSGIYLLWYPIKGRCEADALAQRLRRSGIANVLRAEVAIGPALPEGPLGACGVVVVNPPWTLPKELAAMLPGLATIMGRENGTHSLDWIAAPTGAGR
jgi:23S rRNA (adenine2030-N6)-methyltransferase